MVNTFNPLIFQYTDSDNIEGSGAAGRIVASNIWGLQFKSKHLMKGYFLL